MAVSLLLRSPNSVLKEGVITAAVTPSRPPKKKSSRQSRGHDHEVITEIVMNHNVVIATWFGHNIGPETREQVSTRPRTKVQDVFVYGGFSFVAFSQLRSRRGRHHGSRDVITAAEKKVITAIARSRPRGHHEDTTEIVMTITWSSQLGSATI